MAALSSTVQPINEPGAWITSLDQGDKDNLVGMITQAVEHYGGLTSAARKDIATNPVGLGTSPQSESVLKYTITP